MKCPTCGAEIPENMQFCNVCGTAVASFAPAAPTATARPTVVHTAPLSPAPETKLLGPWAYFGLQILFSIPIVGFILLIVFSLDNSNLNRRNYARSYWCALIVGLVLTLILVLIFGITGAGSAILSEFTQY